MSNKHADLAFNIFVSAWLSVAPAVLVGWFVHYFRGPCAIPIGLVVFSFSMVFFLYELVRSEKYSRDTWE